MTESADSGSMWFAGLFFAVYSTALLIPLWRIFRRLNSSPWLIFLLWMPIVNLIVLYRVAFWTASPAEVGRRLGKAVAALKGQ